MKIKYFFKIAFYCLSFCTSVGLQAQTWQMKQAPLMTEWSDVVKNNPEKSYTSYPRPQMVRKNWVNLNGIWDLAKTKQEKDYLIPTAVQADDVMWKYITGDRDFIPSNGWNADPDYDDAAWNEGASGFGKDAGKNGTPWISETIYLRKKITIGNLSNDDFRNLKLDVFYDEDFWFYINGQLIAERQGHISGYTQINIGAKARAAIKQGQENLIAVKCMQTVGGQYIDAGMFIDHGLKQYGAYYGDQVYDRKILVPFPVESAISGIMDKDFTDQTKWYTYKREFTIPLEMKDKQILLHFGAVDWRCKVFVNGTDVGMHEGGYDPFSFNITAALNNSGKQEIVVQVYDPSSAGGQPRGKQVDRPGIIQYTPASGIWQTVWFEGVNRTYIKDFGIIADPDNSKAVFNVNIENATEKTEMKITILDKGNEVASTIANLNTDIELIIANPKLWDTENPFLYDVKFELKDDGQLVDEVESYFGMRKVSIGKVNGLPWILLNDKPVFQYGVLDQGYWPDGIYCAPTEEALFFDIKKAKEFGFNMIRKHIKTEPAIWYHACDTMGMLVWQDMPNAADGILGDRTWQKDQFYKELKAMVGALKNYPSIVTWVIFNESWGQFDENKNTAHTEKAVSIVEEMDKTRIINSVSGWNDYKLGDIFDRHAYPDPNIYSDGKRAAVCGETGGVSLIDETHQWSKPEMEYVLVDTNEQLKDLFNSFVEETKGLQAIGLCAAVYTQITDVEMEPNGLLFYDRVMKNTPEQIAAIRNRVQSAVNYLNMPVVKTANLEQADWKYTVSRPSGNWTKIEFNDSSWFTGKGGFGSYAPEGAVVGTKWDTGNIWLRRNIDLDLNDEEFENLKALIYYDEDFELYINGVLAASAKGFTTKYVPFEISDAAKAVMNKQGENTIAVHCYQTSGGQYIDFGLTTERAISSLVPDNPSAMDVVKSGYSDIVIYPNPSSGKIYVSSGEDMNIRRITLYDTKGFKVKIVIGSMNSIDIGTLNNGMYIIKIETDKDNYVKRVIKNG